MTFPEETAQAPEPARLRRAARRLLRDARAGHAGALTRFAEHGQTVRHTGALHVLAREHGFASWPRLLFAAEAAGLDRTQRIARLAGALEHGQGWMVQRLLQDDPGLARADAGLMAALYDADGLSAEIARDPGTAVRPVRGNSPILHLAFSCHHRAAPERRAAMLGCARALVAAGADVNDGRPAGEDSGHRLSALYGALGHAGNLALAEWLLEAGADPDDNESLYHATELGALDGVRLLLAHGATIAGTNALPRMLDFDNAEGVRLLLEAGADPNEGVSPHPSGEPSMVIPALHQAARRRCSARIARLLLDHGADPKARWRGHSAYALARVFGNRAVAQVLEEAGGAPPLSRAEALLAAAADGAVPEGTRLGPEEPGPALRCLMGDLVGFGGTLAHLQRLAAIGMDPEWTDGMGLSAVHLAGWEGRADVLSWLLSRGTDVERRNGYGGTLLETVLHGAANCPARQAREHLACLRLVLSAEAKVPRAALQAAPDEEIAAVLEDWAEAHPERFVD